MSPENDHDADARRARASWEAGVTLLVARLNHSGARLDPIKIRAELSHLLALPIPGHPHPEPAFLLMRTIDRLGDHLQTSALRTATALVRIPETHEVLPPAAVLEWAQYWAVRSWRPRFEVHAENVEPEAFSRGLCEIRYETSDANDYAELVSTCLRIRLAALDPRARHVAEAEALFLASAGFTEAAARVRAFEPLAPVLDSQSVEPRSSEHLPPPAATSLAEPARAGLDTEASLTRQGDGWEVVFDRKKAHLKNSKGLRYLAVILSAPFTSQDALDLLTRVTGGPDRSRDSSLQAGEQPEERSNRAAPQAVVDAVAREEIAKQFARLAEERDLARAAADVERESTLQDQIDQLSREAAKSVGKGGDSRTFTDDVLRASQSVSTAIRRAIEAMARHHEPLADHLRQSMHYGRQISYRSARSVVWHVLH